MSFWCEVLCHNGWSTHSDGYVLIWSLNTPISHVLPVAYTVGWVTSSSSSNGECMTHSSRKQDLISVLRSPTAEEKNGQQVLTVSACHLHSMPDDFQNCRETKEAVAQNAMYFGRRTLKSAESSPSTGSRIILKKVSHWPNSIIQKYHNDIVTSCVQFEGFFERHSEQMYGWQGFCFSSHLYLYLLQLLKRSQWFLANR